jgi:DNA-binding NarL/FixJ family response regulator
VIVADDHRLILEAVHASLAGASDIEIVAETHRATQVVPLIARHRPHVVLLDVRMPEIDGWTCLDLIRRRYPLVRVVMFSALPEREVVTRARKGGAAAVVSKRVDPHELAGIVRRVAAGEILEPRGFGSPVPEPDHGLSRRERTILCALASGRSNRQIAEELSVSEQTVKFHLTNIYGKLQVSCRTGAVRFAYEQGLIERPLTAA